MHRWKKRTDTDADSNQLWLVWLWRTDTDADRQQPPVVGLADEKTQTTTASQQQGQ